MEFDGVRLSVRRHVCDLIEEYGRHTGHADVLREAVDGRVGEDPPDDWRLPSPKRRLCSDFANAIRVDSRVRRAAVSPALLPAVGRS